MPDADPAAADLTGAFAEAMGAAPKPKEPPPPPPVDPDAPHGRDDDGQPLAPFGLTRDGKPRRSAAGRKPSDARLAKPADVAAAAAAAAPAPAEAGKPASHYEEGLSEFATQVWLLVGFVSPADAGALDVNSEAMVKAWAKAAEQDATVRRAVNWLCQETWVSGVAMATVPFAAMVLANHGMLPGRIMAKDQQASQREQLAAMTEAKRQRVFGQMVTAPQPDGAEAGPGPDA